MITATDEAKIFLAEAMKKTFVDPAGGECFRLAKEGQSRLTVVKGHPTTNDIAITHGDDTILVIESGLADQIGDRTLDVKDDRQGGKGLIFI